MMTNQVGVPPPVPTPWELRDDLVARVTADLLGPLDGEDEVIRGYQRDDGTWSSPGRVRDRYLVGMLAPQGTVAVDPERDDDIGPEEGDDAASGGIQDGRNPRLVLAQSSMGLSVVVDGSVDRLIARCSWGQYDREFEDQDDGSRASVWVRTPRQVEAELALDGREFGPLPVNGEGIVLRGRSTRSPDGESSVVTVFLSNEQEQVEFNKDGRWMFQAGVELVAPDGGDVFLGRDTALAGAAGASESEQAELAQLDLQYRDIVEFAAGHGVGTDVDVSATNPRRAARVSTTVIPRYEVWRTNAPGAAPELDGLITDMQVLSELEPERLHAALLPLAEGYRAWLGDELGRIGDPDARLEGHEQTARDVIAEAVRIADAIAAGIELVCTNPDALDAFRFANQAMWRQRVHSVAIQDRRADPDLSLSHAVADADLPEHRSWRPFQLAFILQCIPSLTDPAHPERSKHGALADLLFFPTGGGKTEAYLGLVAYTLATRRLQGVVGEGDDVVDGRDGVAVVMRYTLRLLTAQQFQRAATLICAAELLRQQRAETDSRYGGVPFRLGMWVGGSVSPNTSGDAARFAVDAKLGGFSGGRATPVQLTDCPWCGQTIEPGADGRFDNVLQRFLIFCGNVQECSFAEASSNGEGIPVITVDEEIYRLVPSFVIGTIDKFAQLPWNGATATLFGRVDSRCERHGYRNPDLDRAHRSQWQENDSHRNSGEHPSARTVPSLRLRPPDLIIQDEMHLVTGPLGTMAGLYETAIDRLATWTLNNEDVRPKVVASTATTRRAREQAWSVFWRDLRIFPPPALDVHRSFFAEQVRPSPETPGRRYLGICAHGERLKQVELRVFSSVMAAAKAIWDELAGNAEAADPWMTTVGYFNAVRELAGMRRMAEDELRTKLRRARFTRGLANRRVVEMKELTSRVSSDDIKSILRQLFVAHVPDRPEDSERPIDLLLATNMISVGVDVPRLASMVVVGQPKSTAEYIQATSRVGRDDKGPGLVITLYNWARPRDLSHYETFEHYHATFYRHVEPLSVTPFSERALDKGLTGVLVAAVRHGNGDWNANQSARNLNRPDERIAAHVQAIAERAEAVTGDLSAAALTTSMANQRLDAWERERALRPELSYALRTADDVALLARPEAGEWSMWTCPNSLRDTEVQANLQIIEKDPTYESGSQPEIRLTQPAGDDRPEIASDEEVHEAIDMEEAEDRAANGSRP